MDFLKQQSSRIQKNGIWVVTTNSKAYSAEELKDLEELKRICKAEGIALFICRGSELPDGWKRFSNLGFVRATRDRA